MLTSWRSQSGNPQNWTPAECNLSKWDSLAQTQSSFSIYGLDQYWVPHDNGWNKPETNRVWLGARPLPRQARLIQKNVGRQAGNLLHRQNKHLKSVARRQHSKLAAIFSTYEWKEVRGGSHDRQKHKLSISYILAKDQIDVGRVAIARCAREGLHFVENE